MELLHLLPLVLVAKLAFYFKVSVVFLLCILNMYLIFTYNKEELPNKELQSGFNINNFKGLLTSLATAGGFLSAIITVKNELKSVQIGKLDQLQTEEREGIRRSIDKDTAEHQRLLASIESNREELYKLQLDRAKLLGNNDRLLTLQGSLKNNINSYISKSTEPSTKLSDLGILDQLIKQDTKKFSQEFNSLTLNIEQDQQPAACTVLPSPEKEENVSLEGTSSSLDIKKSNILNLDLFSNLEWFEGLNGIKKIAVSMIIGKSVIFSALVSIIFIFYGNILIEKYDLINKYPRLATIIQLRQKFQKYYFKFYCGLILTIIIIEVSFGIAVLLL